MVNGAACVKVGAWGFSCALVCALGAAGARAQGVSETLNCSNADQRVSYFRKSTSQVPATAPAHLSLKVRFQDDTLIDMETGVRDTVLGQAVFTSGGQVISDTQTGAQLNRRRRLLSVTGLRITRDNVVIYDDSVFCEQVNEVRQ